MMTKRIIISLLIFLLFCLAVFFGVRLISGKYAAGGSESSPGKVVLIGMDGATFTVLDPLLARGEVPAIKKLMDEGAFCALRSEEPMYSPILWTTIFTGVSPDEHGVKQFIHRLTDMGEGIWRMYNSHDRKAYALWNLASAAEKSVCMIGFWNTWPAEKVNGWMVSDHVAYSSWSYLDPMSYSYEQGLTYPSALYNDIKSLIYSPDDLTKEMALELGPFTSEETDEILALEKPNIHLPGSPVKFDYLSQLSYENISFRLLEKHGQPDLMGVYLIATDSLGHKCWQYYEPDKFQGVSLEKAHRLEGVIPAIYRHDDAYISKLLSAISPDSTVIIISDHGMKASGELTEVSGDSGIHDINGIFIAWGKNIRRGVKPEKASIYDVAPTILTLLNMPVPENLKGRVLTEIIEKNFLDRFPVRTVPPLEPRSNPSSITQQTVMEKYYMDNLRSLGYIR